MLDWSSVDAILDSFTVGNVDAVSLVFAHVTVVLRVTHTCRGDTLLAQVAIIVPATQEKNLLNYAEFQACLIFSH